MRETYLVQRLRKPHRGGGTGGALAALAFGGGLRNGGLTKEALELLHGLFEFDYMGSAEFEFGAVPAALRSLAVAAEKPSGLETRRIDIPLSDVQPHWKAVSNHSHYENRAKWKTDGTAEVWALYPAGWSDEVEARVRALAADRSSGKLKERAGLADTLRPWVEWDSDGTEARGWLELDNGFMFFADREMWAGTCELFGTEAKE